MPTDDPAGRPPPPPPPRLEGTSPPADEAVSDSRPSSDSPGADPAVTAGLESGSGVTPGDTPPSADSMSAAAGAHGPNTGPVSGNRTPMFIALGVLGLLVVMVAVLVGASFFPSS